MGGLFEGGTWKVFLVIGHMPVKIFLLISYFFFTTHTSNRLFAEGQAIFR